MRNIYPGTCYRCGKLVNVGDGYVERDIGKRWRVQHAACYKEYRKKIFKNEPIETVLDV